MGHYLVVARLRLVICVCGLIGGGSFLVRHVDAQTTNFSFPSGFRTPERFVMVEDVQHYAEGASFWMNAKSMVLRKPTCGRLLYKDRVRMKDAASGAVASFSTAFTFSISGVNYVRDGFGVVHGDGLAFTFARNNSLSGEDPGGWICLIKDADNGKSTNRMFAVEFDTFINEEYGDPSDSHVGVNVNSLTSTVSYNLCGGRVQNCSYLCNGGEFTAWIDYDSPSQSLEVFFANGSLVNNVAKPLRPLLNASLPLRELLDEYMYVGFSASTGSLEELHEIQSWTFTSSGMPELPPAPPPDAVTGLVPGSDSSSASKVGVIAGVSAGAVGALLLVCFLIYCCRRRTSYKRQDKFNLVDQNLVPRMFSYRELSKATKNFNRSELLGSGGFGAVYKGTLPSGAVVAVKRMRNECTGGEESFQAEAASLSQIRHRNLVQLRGWCHEEEQLFLVYDYMCNGSLDDWLFHFNRSLERGNGMEVSHLEALPLTIRHSVLSGVAAALAYLHEECAQCVLHRDIKSSNVLLDGDLHAYLGDFGLARLIDHRKMEKTTMMAGTLGYMAPEMPHTGKATKETDVYSFGVLMLEVLCGARPLDMAFIERGDGVLADRVWRAHEAGNILQVADPSLELLALESGAKSMSSGGVEYESMLPVLDSDLEDVKMVTNLLRLGLLCCNPNPEGRPSMRTVSQLMQQSSENMEKSTPALPSTRPANPYSRRGFSELDVRNLSTLSRVVRGQAAGRRRGSSSASPPSSLSELSSIDEPAALQTSFVASSAVFSGR